MCDYTLENSAQHRQAGNEEGTQPVRTLRGIVKHSLPQKNSSINGGFGVLSQDKELSHRRLALHMRSIKRLEGDSVAKH
jgi:hypothetical protein